MNLFKSSQYTQPQPVTAGELEEINRWSRTPLSPQEVYTFSVLLCDNEVDRDFERFHPDTLHQLAPLFVGKSGLMDHLWSSQVQTARIYRTEVIRELDRQTRAGDPYSWLKGYAYLLRLPANEDLIAQIDGGIKREVSVGCAVQRAVCSICGAESPQSCGHQPGRHYDQGLCYTSLEGATDAYEFSFVAVPAQPNAGVLKGFEPSEARPSLQLLRQLVQDSASGRAALATLEREAAVGRSYLLALRQDVVRLGTLAEPKMDVEVLQAIAQKLEAPELETLKETYTLRATQHYPLTVQLPHQTTAPASGEDSPFLI